MKDEQEPKRKEITSTADVLIILVILIILIVFVALGAIFSMGNIF